MAFIRTQVSKNEFPKWFNRLNERSSQGNKADPRANDRGIRLVQASLVQNPPLPDA